MKIVAVRPKRRRKREETKVALYTVAFDLEELMQHDSSFLKYCKQLCINILKQECSFQFNEDGEYGRLLHIWEQQDYLIAFFSNQMDKLATDRYGNITREQAIQRNKLFLYELRRTIMSGELDTLFQPLYKSPSKDVKWPESKFKLKVKGEEFENVFSTEP